MNARITAVLLALLVILGGAALYYQRRSSEQPANLSALGAPLLKHLNAANVAVVAIHGPKGALTLRRGTKGWTISQRAGFPADFAKVKAFVVKALELRIGQVVPISASDRGPLDLLAPGKGKGAGTQVKFETASGKSLGVVLVGAKYFKREPSNRAAAPADGRFVLMPEHPRTAYVVADPLAQATTASAAWIDRAGFTVYKVRSLEVRPAQGGGWEIERATPNGDWHLLGSTRGEKLDVAKANAAAYSLNRVPLADVAAPQLTAEAAGLDHPEVITARSFDGLAYTIKLGKATGQDYYATLSIAGTPSTERSPEKSEKPAARKRRDAAYAAHLKRLEARLPRERALSKYVLLLRKSDFADVLKQRADLLQKATAHRP